MHEVIMPKLGLTMESGKIEKWHKKEGDKVEAGDILFEVMTDKVSLEVESYHSGILKKILRSEGEEVPVTEVVAYIGEKDEEVPSTDNALSRKKTEEIEEKKDEEGAEVMKIESSIKESGQEEDIEKIIISPLAKKLAIENNIDMSNIKGSGPRGRIIKEDILTYLESRKGDANQRIRISPLARKTASELGIDWKVEKITGSGLEGRIVKDDILSFVKLRQKAKTSIYPAAKEAKIKSSSKLAGIRKVIAQRMSLSKSTIPHIILNAKADATNLIDLKEKLKDIMAKKYGVKITYTDFILKAAALSLREYLEVNSSFVDDVFTVYKDINVGLAISIEDGLIVPTIFGTDKLELSDIARKRTELVEKARSAKLSLEEISNGTFTVTNLGMYGIRSFSAIINPPQAAILAVGEIYQEPAVVGSRIEARWFVEFSLARDHRIVDGALGARYLQKLVEFIENPIMLVI